MKVYFTRQALQDLEAIRDYFNKFAPYKTEDIIFSIIDCVTQLEEYPLSGTEESFLKKIGLKRRFLVKGNYKIIYRVENHIYITQIFDARQDPMKMMSNEKNSV